ncbi:MAG TPA: fatty acid desaturase [Planctomycetaceae bacterium]|nr:fatty acid desaturase [Planctomycetaceae bacterium]HCD01872.1 fatty acid desaturase [Planctomycetaceae bacterium]
MSTDTVFTPEESQALATKTTKWNLNVVRLGLFVLVILEIVWRYDEVGYPGWLSSDRLVTPTWWLATYTLAVSYFIFCWTSAYHETVHQTLSAHNNFNKHLGRIIGTVVLIPYTVYRETHITHHAYLNRPTDWELWPYSDPNRGRGFRRAFAMFDLLFGFCGAIIIYGRIFWSKNSPLSESSRRLIRREYLASAICWSGLAVYLTLSHTWLDFLQVWWIPLTIAGFLQTMRKFTEHLGMASFDPLLGTRTVRGRNWLTRITSFLNFDIFVHGPHHRHPRVAHTSLGELMDDYVDANPERDLPVYPTYARATLAMLPWLVRNPGVGVNVGAADPSATGDVKDFVQDVSREVLAPAEVGIE